MSEMSTMDIPFSPEMGGSEALSALGYSRVQCASADRHEIWSKNNYNRESYIMSFTKIELSATYAMKYSQDAKDDGYSRMVMSIPETQACIMRCKELSGDRQ